MMMSHFLGHNDFMKMILIVLFVFVFLQTTPATATGKLSMLAEAGGGADEELVKWAGYGEEKLSTVVVSGKLLCHGENNDPFPVSGGKVAVLCGTSAKTKKSWTKLAGSTDHSGDFLIDLPSHLHAIPNLEKVCHVRVVHLPKTSPCWQSACTRKHRQMIKLAAIGEGIRSYTTNNINLVPDLKHK